MHLEFCGAAQEVTGSCHRLQLGGTQLLVDCGLFQGGRDADARNAEPFPFNAADIEAVVLTHAHLDHSGRLPLLVQRGFRGGIWCHPATADLVAIMLEDSAGIIEHETAVTNRKRERKGLPPIKPLYTRADAEAVLEHLRPLRFGETVEIADGVRLRLQDAGHILGSAIAEL